MKKYKYVVIDDDDMDRLTFGFYLKEYDFLQHAASFSSPGQGLEYILANEVDIAFLDIEMPGMSGIEIQNAVKEKVAATVFVTSHPDFAVEGFNLDVVDYVMKPFDRKRLDHCMEKLRKMLDKADKADMYEETMSAKTISLKEGFKTVKVSAASIVYIEAMRDYSKIVLRSGPAHHIRSNLSKTLKNGEFADFVRIHKSFAVQKSHVAEISSRSVKMTNGVTLPVGGLYKDNIKLL